MERGDAMARTVAVGVQDFEKIVSNGYFYIDKTNFIKEWWESADEVLHVRGVLERRLI